MNSTLDFNSEAVRVSLFLCSESGIEQIMRNELVIFSHLLQNVEDKFNIIHFFVLSKVVLHKMQFYSWTEA